MTETIDYRGNHYTPEEFERQFNPRANVPDVDAVQAERVRLATAVRGALDGVLDVPYGPGPRQTVDIFPSGRNASPALLFFHGGYWRAGHARENSFVAEGLVAAGATVFVATYDLCPAVTVADIVEQSRQAIAWVHAHAARYGADPDRLHIAGHSAGAHLCAMALAYDWSDSPGGPSGRPNGPIKGACMTAGIYDMAPVLNISVNADIGLTRDDIEPLSPLRRPPRAPVPLIVAVGLAESGEWIAQSRLYADAARAAGCDVTYIEMPEAHHYSILLPMREPGHPVTSALIAMLGLS